MCSAVCSRTCQRRGRPPCFWRIESTPRQFQPQQESNKPRELTVLFILRLRGCEKYSFASRIRACDALGHVQPAPRPRFYQHLKLLINICYRQTIDWQCGYWISRKRAWLSFGGGFSEQPRELNGRGDMRFSSSHDAVPELRWLLRTSIDLSASVDAVCC